MFVRVSNILLRNYCANILKRIFVIFKVRFHHEGTSVKVAILSLSSQLAMKPRHTKNQLRLSPPSCFSKCFAQYLLILFDKYLLQFFGSKIWAITFAEITWFWQIYLFSLRNKTLLLNIFLAEKKRPNGHLNL